MNKLFILLSFLLLSVSSYSQTTAKDYAQRGLNKYNLEDFKGAIEDCTKAIELDAKDAIGYYNRGMSKAKLKDYTGAILDYSRGIELDPKFEKAYYNRGLIKILIKQKDSGCLDFSKAGELGYKEAYDMIKQYCQLP